MEKTILIKETECDSGHLTTIETKGFNDIEALGMLRYYEKVLFNELEKHNKKSGHNIKKK